MIELGDKIRDKVSGMIGVATEKREYLNGCIQFAVSPKVKSDATELPGWCIDEGQLEIVKKGFIKPKKKAIKKNSGGPTIKIH